MGRQFFVGGNFKMNPSSREAKQTLIKGLNDANLDSSVGAYVFIFTPPVSYRLYGI